MSLPVFAPTHFRVCLVLVFARISLIWFRLSSSENDHHSLMRFFLFSWGYTIHLSLSVCLQDEHVEATLLEYGKLILSSSDNAAPVPARRTSRQSASAQPDKKVADTAAARQVSKHTNSKHSIVLKRSFFHPHSTTACCIIQLLPENVLSLA